MAHKQAPLRSKLEKLNGTDTEQEEMELAKGCLVRLASGGPVMTVLLIDEGLVTCSWFAVDRAGVQVPTLGVYPEYALTGVNENELFNEA